MLCTTQAGRRPSQNMSEVIHEGKTQVWNILYMISEGLN